MDLEKILPKDGPPINEVTKYIEKYKNDLIKISSERDSNHRIMQTKDVVINRLESDIKSKNDKSRRLERELREVKNKYYIDDICSTSKIKCI
mgnify:CR=1 FL=1